MIQKIKDLLNSQREVVFAYLYGSFLTSKDFRDIDIAVYLKDGYTFGSAVDLQMRLAKILSIPADLIDLQIINDILKNPDGFSWLYLERLLKKGRLIVSKDSKILSNFLENFSNRYREVVALLDEIK